MAPIKKLYQAMAAAALVNLLVLAGGGIYLVAKGNLTVERLRHLVEVVRGTADVPPKLDVAQADEATPTEPSDAEPVSGSVEDEIARRNAERVILEADQRLILANRQLVKVRHRSEELERQEAEQRRIRTQEEEERETEAFQKDLEILSLLKPKVAVESLMARPEDAAARLLMAMDGRATKKIFEAASKDPRSWAKMLAIQERFHELSAESGAGAEATTQTRP